MQDMIWGPNETSKNDLIELGRTVIMIMVTWRNMNFFLSKYKIKYFDNIFHKKLPQIVINSLEIFHKKNNHFFSYQIK